MAVEGADEVLANLQKWADWRVQAAEEAMREVTAALEGWARAECPALGEASPHSQTAEEHIVISGEVAEAGAEIVRGMISAEMSAETFQKLVRSGRWAWLWPVLLRHEGDILKVLAARLGGGAASTSAGGSS